MLGSCQCEVTSIKEMPGELQRFLLTSLLTIPNNLEPSNYFLSVESTGVRIASAPKESNGDKRYLKGYVSQNYAIVDICRTTLHPPSSASAPRRWWAVCVMSFRTRLPAGLGQCGSCLEIRGCEESGVRRCISSSPTSSLHGHPWEGLSSPERRQLL